MTCWFDVLEQKNWFSTCKKAIKNNKDPGLLFLCIKCNYQRFTVYIMYMVQQDGMMYPTYGYILDFNLQLFIFHLFYNMLNKCCCS